jgi:hypothetical protein
MGEFLVAEAIFEQRRSEYLAERYRREWYQFQAVDRLEKKLRLGKNRLGLHAPTFGRASWERSPGLEQ